MIRPLAKFTSIFILFLLFVSPNFSQAQTENLKKETFKVWGNCDMCKKTIDNAVKSIDGVKSGKWSVASGKMVVKFDATQTSLEDIKKAIAAAGYDTEEHRADDEVYSKLHHCCQYERPK